MACTPLLEFTKSWTISNTIWNSEYQVRAIAFLPNVQFRFLVGNGKEFIEWFCVRPTDAVDEQKFDCYFWAQIDGRIFGLEDVPKSLDDLTWLNSSANEVELNFKIVYKNTPVHEIDGGLLKKALLEVQESLRKIEENQRLQTKVVDKEVSKLIAKLSDAEEEREKLRNEKVELKETVREMKEEHERASKYFSKSLLELSVYRDYLSAKLQRTEERCEKLEYENAMLVNVNGGLKDLMDKKDEGNQRKVDNVVGEMSLLIDCVHGMKLHMNEIKFGQPTQY
ncbi:hypothetical protein M3Y98_00071800 [Aphelenchoides besseyi]|nr:hypothetical protein M3Y98_00071800 [Aphelenchoides besseyi]